MAVVEYPSELKKSTWDKKAGAIQKGSDLENSLKALQKDHEAVAWDSLRDWTAGVSVLADLQKKYDERKKIVRSKVPSLKRDALALATEATAFGKSKGLEKVAVDASRVIAAAARRYQEEMEAVDTVLEREFSTAAAELEDDEADSVLLDPEKLLRNLNRCKADSTLRFHFALVDGVEGGPPGLTLSAKTVGSTLLTRLKSDTGAKSGAFGFLRMDGTAVSVQTESTLSSLLQKLKLTLKAVGFRASRVLLVDAAGGTLASEDGDDPPNSGTPGDEGARTAVPVEKSAEQLNYEATLLEVEPLLAVALRANVADASKFRAAVAFAQEKAEGNNYAAALRTILGLKAALAKVSPEELLAAFKLRGNGLVPKVKEAIAAGKPDSQLQRTRMTEANALAQKGDFVGAGLLLDQVENWLEGRLGAVAYGKLLLRWREAQQAAVDGLAEFSRVLLSTPEVVSDPRFKQVQKGVARLPELIPQFGQDLADHLDALTNGAPNQEEHRAAARTTITTYRQQLAGVPALAKLAEFAARTLKTELKVTADLDAALQEISATLAS